MIAIDVFEPGDLAAMTVQKAQAELATVADRQAHGAALAASGRSFTVRSTATGEIVMCAGALETHGDYATLWAAVAPAAGPLMVAITWRVRRFVRMLPHRRIDAIVRADFGRAHDWMAMLDFSVEAVLRQYFADGSDAMIYRWAQ